jgi:hypothetical protein
MHDQDTQDRDCRISGVYYPRFGGDLGVERHWEVQDVERLLFGAFGTETSPRSAEVVQLKPENNPVPQNQILLASTG